MATDTQPVPTRSEHTPTLISIRKTPDREPSMKAFFLYLVICLMGVGIYHQRSMIQEANTRLRLFELGGAEHIRDGVYRKRTETGWEMFSINDPTIAPVIVEDPEHKWDPKKEPTLDE